MHLPTYISGTIQTKAYRILREHVYDVLRAYGITPSHWAMLGIILQARDGVRQTDIATFMHVKAPLITSMAHTLQKHGYIQIIRAQIDARAKLLAMTPQGKKFVKLVEVTLNEKLVQLVDGLSETDLSIYHKVLRTIIQNDTLLQKQG